jgi:ubiquinol-cytochrome c reductase cytochrome b subunit
MPSFDVVIGHYTLVPNPFWGGVGFPLAVLGVLAVFPWVERWLSGDRRVHNLLDRPRDAPNRTAFGVAFLTFVFMVFAFGAADRAYVLFGVSYETLLNVFRVAIWVVPVALFVIVRRLCRELQQADVIEIEREGAEDEAEQQERAMREQGEPVI